MFRNSNSKTKFWLFMVVGLVFTGFGQTLSIGFLYYWLMIIGIIFMFIGLFFFMKSTAENVIGFIRYVLHKIRGGY